MKTNMFKFGAIALVFSLISCEEDILLGGEGGVEQQLGAYLIEAEAISSNVYNTIDLARRDSAFIASGVTTVDGAAVSTSANGDTITVNYGVNGTYGADGKLRKGKIRVLESGNYLSVTGKLYADLIGYSIDDVPVQGAIEAKNEGNDSLSLKIQNLSVSNEFTFNSNKGVKWLSGFNTLNDVSDDRYKVGGTSSTAEQGTNHVVSVDFADAMIYDRTCQFGAEAGILDMTLAGDSVSFTSGSIDFIASDGCNNVFTLTINSDEGQTLNFTKTFDGF